MRANNLTHLIRRTAVVLATVAALGAPAIASADQVEDSISAALRNSTIDISRLKVVNVDGIVIVRGEVTTVANQAKAAEIVRGLGYERVANMVRVVAVPDDERIRRAAERELTLARSLDGCRFRVACVDGVVTLEGNVQYELQKDAATSLVRTVPGVRQVNVLLSRS